ncbi:hypothetical protein [Gimesia panareensis]|uniref:Uncharacterized protein n=1 Tax=Gimesia panareensis TaxID=2527978 RepID=A0A518ACN2_9PLAN|nr:hypothetical protein [Gimesia panareensis]QDT29415.1 hypothetical protein Enr10x_47690 [Gimesia panareensis]QDU52463.1 hypothetical protein Pan110_48420 [Gimesia panareensis]
MKPYDTSGMLENEDELESVLRAYFQQEMPPELQELTELSDEEFEAHYRQLRAEGNATPEHPEPVSRRGYQRGLLVSALSVCLIAGLAWVFYPKTPEQPVLTSQPPASEAELTTQPAEANPVMKDVLDTDPDTLVVLDQGEAPLEMTPEVDDNIQESIDITLYNTELGPVEQRTELSWTNITVENPETGSHVKMSMPELTIDFVPVNKSSLSLIGDETDSHEQQQ